MNDLTLVYSDEFKKHVMDRAHPESPERLDWIIKAAKELMGEYEEKIDITEPQQIELDDLLSVHVPDHIAKIESISRAGGGIITLDTTLNEHTFSVAKLAAGATKLAVKLVDENHSKTSFAAVRPPGHHAEVNSAGGFCFFNNISIAAEWLISKKGYRRIVILDIDHHFGNGTSHIFYHRSEVLYISIHAHPMYSYPGTGYPTEIGIADGMGYNVNIPLLPGTETIDWLYALNFASNIIHQYQPEIILVSVGFDALGGDPVGVLSLNNNAFFAAGYIIRDLANELCNGKISCTLEGGYKMEDLKEVSKKFFKGILGYKPKIVDKFQETNITSHTNSMLGQVKRALKDYWKF
ncbi:MAG: histone deacetylase family protein [Candidatus Thorarchaeota archaeon]